MASPTVPTASQSESDVLDVRAEIWQKRPLLRDIYHRYFAEMCDHLATTAMIYDDQSRDREGATGTVPPPPPLPHGRSLTVAALISKCNCPQNFGTILEIGGGSGNFKEYFHAHHANQGMLITSDIVPTPHCDLAADAMALPFHDNTLDNIVMMDVLHHIPFPLKFFAEAQRTLRPGGRILMTEPYISPISRLLFKLAHPEPVDLSTTIFASQPGAPDPSPLRGQGAFASNQATPTLIFYRDLPQFQQRFRNLKLILRKRRSLLLYPLSGGFSGPKLLPHTLAKLLWPLEKILSPLSPLLAFRLLIVLENSR
ncbi:MAG: class I SAM-dependent methyltransferase [Phycisphaerales bacterium]|nr:class I SAM-dependent methyltransferase [Phycisphaerales bacterium]